MEKAVGFSTKTELYCPGRAVSATSRNEAAEEDIPEDQPVLPGVQAALGG